MQQLQRAKALSAEADQIKEHEKEHLLPILVAYGVKDYSVQGLGKVTVKVSKGSSINNAKLREQLLIEGISPTKIDSIISRASNTWEKEYVEFKKENGS